MRKIFENRTILGIASIVLALILSFGVTPLLNKAMIHQETIIRAKEDIKKGEKITTEKITKVKVGGYNLPAEVIKEENKLIGKYAKSDIYKDDYFLQSKVSDSIDNGTEYLDRENIEISITVKSSAAGLSGNLKSGDIISVISSSDEGVSPHIIPELQYVKVISATSKELDDIEGEKRQLASTINLIVEKIQAEKLVKEEQSGNIHIALVYRGEKRIADEYLERQKQYLLSINKEEGEIIGEIETPEDTETEQKEVTENEITGENQQEEIQQSQTP